MSRRRGGSAQQCMATRHTAATMECWRHGLRPEGVRKVRSVSAHDGGAAEPVMEAAGARRLFIVNFGT